MSNRAWRHGVLCVLAGVLVASRAVDAQRRPSADALPKTAPSATAVRAEMAGVLLQAKKYGDAAREYRALLSRDTSNFEYRLGLARALAWGGKPRDAERELRALQARHLQILTVDSLLRSVRDAMDPNASEAAAWVAERPTYAPYRVALARALVREHLARLAAVQYDTLLMGTSLGPTPETIALRREQAHAYLDAGDAVTGAARLRDVLRLTPRDTAIRHELAVVLAGGVWGAEGRAQYDTLLATAQTADLYTERARLRLAVRDTSGAESDLGAAMPLGATSTAYLMLGDLYRARGDFGPARSMYRLALMHLDEDEDRMAVGAALAQMAREERPVAAFIPTVGDDPGWRITTEGVGDNLGVHYAASTIRRTAPIGSAARVGVAVVNQYLGERSPSRSIDLTAVGAEASLAGEVGYGPLLIRAGAEGGALHLPDSRTIPIGSATLAAWVSTWALAVRTFADAAYPTLLTTTSIRPLTGTGDAITQRSNSAALGGPLGPADIAVSGEQTRLSDGNRRTTVEGLLRFPLMPGLNAVYSGNRIEFAKRSTRYWDPISYVSHAAGLELASRADRGFTAALRVLPGESWSTEAAPPVTGGRTSRAPPPPIKRSTFQIGGGGDIGWRDPRWEGAAALTYGSGRDGDYRRLGATLALRILR